MPSEKKTTGHGFGTAPVFLAAISTILGAIMFLRFGYAVGHTGLMGGILIVLIGHMITIPTGLAIAEIATNLKVRGGGEYYIISRSFGSTLGGTIGISLYLSQAISVAFYLIAFAEAFRPLFPWITSMTGLVPDVRMFSMPIAIGMAFLIMRKGASIGVGALWGIVLILGASLVLFFAGRSLLPPDYSLPLFGKVEGPDSFFRVFAIVFPAFTGMTAGVGLSGDLKNPRRSIPLGTLSATLTGLIVYIFIVIKLSKSALPADPGAAIVIVQHLDEQFSVGLAEWLNGQCALKVVVAREGDRPRRDEALIASTNDHLILGKDLVLHYTGDPRNYPYRPSVDEFFGSLEKHWPRRDAAVLLTGMGRDGGAGMAALRKAGWHTIAQDEKTSVVYGMPAAAVELGGAAEILPLEAIAAAVMKRLKGNTSKG